MQPSASRAVFILQRHIEAYKEHTLWNGTLFDTRIDATFKKTATDMRAMVYAVTVEKVPCWAIATPTIANEVVKAKQNSPKDDGLALGKARYF